MTRPSRFYVTGGTLPANAGSYISRGADTELLEGLLAGEFCYVLNTRQMGKSSLMVRTAERLQDHGITVLALDLTAIGHNVTVEQWYGGLLHQMGRELALDNELDGYWRAYRHLGPMQRWMGALRDVVTPGCPAGIVVFVDEIDVVRSLPFSTDEFFAGIRECYNLRANRPELERLTFCLLGVATPASLIRDTRMTPFNIGRRIDLDDFTEEEAAPLATGLNGTRPGRTLLRRVLYWTGGHPYLTQRLCQAVADDPAATTARDVDRHCQTLFLSRRAQERDDNLLFVRDRILRADGDVVTVLDLYSQIRADRSVAADDLRPGVTGLLLAGLVRAEGRRLVVRNRIYRSVFDRAWIYERMPDAEMRRQRIAYRRGLLRATTASAIVTLVMLALVITAASFARSATKNRHEADHRATYAQNLARRLQQEVRAREQEVRAKKAMIAQRDQAILRAEAALVESRYQRVQAIHGRDQALRLQQLAERKIAESDERLSRMYIARGMAEAFLGNPLEALPWLVQALDLDRTNPARERMGRIRIATLLETAPRLAGFWPTVENAFLYPDIDHIVAWGDAGTTWDVRTGRRIRGLQPGYLHGRVITATGDQRICASEMAPDTVRVWNVSTGRPLTPPLHHRRRHETLESGTTEGGVGALFSRDGRLLATYAGRSVCVWDVASGKRLGGPLNHEVHINGLCFNADGTRLFVGCGQWNPTSDGGLFMWNLEDPIPTATPLVRHIDTAAPTISPNGQCVLSLQTPKGAAAIRMLDGASGRLLWTRDLPRIYYSALFSPDGKRVLTHGFDEPQSLWDAETGNLVHEFPAVAGSATATFSPGGDQIAIGGRGGALRIWDIASGRQVSAPLPNGYATFSPNGRYVLIASGPAGTRLWDLRPKTPGVEIDIRPAMHLGWLAYSSDGRWIMGIGDRDGARLHVWDARTGRRGMVPAEPMWAGDRWGWAPLPAFRPGRDAIALAGPGDTVRIWNPATGGPLTPPLRHGKAVTHIAFSPDGRLLVTGCLDGTARVWDAETGAPALPPLRAGAPVWQTMFTLDGRRLVTATATSQVQYWDAGTGRPLGPPRSYASAAFGIWSHSASPDGRLLGVGLQLYDTRTGKPAGRRPETFGKGAWDSSGRRIAVIEGKRVRIQDAWTGRLLAPPLDHSEPVASAQFSPDGRILETSGTTPGLRPITLWDAATGEPLSPPIPNGWPLVPVSWLHSPAGSAVARQRNDGILRLGSVPLDTRPIGSLRALSRAMTGHPIVQTDPLGSDRRITAQSGLHDVSSRARRGPVSSPQRDARASGL